LQFNRDMAPLHGDATFQSALAEIERDMARQRADLQRPAVPPAG
jgi:hypothetical protein